MIIDNILSNNITKVKHDYDLTDKYYSGLYLHGALELDFGYDIFMFENRFKYNRNS